jgi:STE24 endopeptidase
MAKANGVPSDKIFIYDGSKQSNRYTANVSGLGSTARVAMSDVMFKKDADLAEVRAVVGHEMGHYKHNDVMGFAAVFGILGLVAFFLIDKLFPTVAALLGARDVQGIGDAAGFPIISIILAVLALLATPITSSITRIAETNADQFSLERVNEPDGLARALAKTIEYRAATPSKLEEVLFYDHPAVGNRIRMAMDWKAAHPAPAPAAPVAAAAAPAAAPAP